MLSSGRPCGSRQVRVAGVGGGQPRAAGEARVSAPWWVWRHDSRGDRTPHRAECPDSTTALVASAVSLRGAGSLDAGLRPRRAAQAPPKPPTAALRTNPTLEALAAYAAFGSRGGWSRDAAPSEKGNQPNVRRAT